MTVIPWERVDKTDSCWWWTGGTRKGYGYLAAGAAHRFFYEALVGPIPDGLQIDHLCRNTLCVNPDHLEPVTQHENMRRRYATQTHCIRGHERNEENSYVRYSGGKHTQCRLCNPVSASPPDRNGDAE